MKTFTMFMLGMFTIFMAFGQCVYFSEYLEGTGNNKCLEVYNGTGKSLDLAAEGYIIYIYANGGNSPTGTVMLTGTLAPGAVTVVCNPGADSAILALADQTSGNVNFNGDDAVELINNNGMLDVIGQIGHDPGSEWTGSTCTSGSANGTLIRKATLACPSFDGNTDFDPDDEWDCFPVNTYLDLGNHIMTACVITDFELIMDSCASGIARANLSYYVNNSASSAFELLITPDPGTYSGVYDYVGSLPFSIDGLLADSLTDYHLVIQDTADATCQAEISSLLFDCPVANKLSFAVIPPGCVGENNQFILEVCAIDSVSGKVQTDYQDSITLILDPSANGSITGNLTALAENGCASFLLSHNTTEAISFTATDGMLENGHSGNIIITDNCASLILHKAVINPCGDDSRNEFFGGNTGNAPVSVGDLFVANINPSSGSQPNTNFTWSASGNDDGGNPTETCGAIGLQCNRILDINNSTDSLIIIDLIDSLNIHAACTNTLFVAPQGTNLGTIPAYSKVLFFFGGGGNTSGTILPGFDDLNTNFDFSLYCGEGPIYTIFGNHKNASATFGFFSNSAARTYYISVNGNISTDLTYANPGGSGETETVRENGIYEFGQACTPLDLFAPQPLTAELLSFSGESVADQGILLSWDILQNWEGREIWLERINKAGDFERITIVEFGTEKGSIQKFDYLDEKPFSGINSYRLKFIDLEGNSSYSQVVDIEYVIIDNFQIINAWPNPITDQLNLKIRANKNYHVRFQLISTIGKSVLVRNLNLSAGVNEITLELSSIPRGVYLYAINGLTSTHWGKLIKR